MISQLTQDTGAPAINLAEIERRAARLADASLALDDTLTTYEEELQAVNAKYLRPLKRQAAEAATAEAELHSAIESAPHLFVKPRTLTLHGLKIGFSVSEGKLVIEDEETSVKLLKRKFPEQIDTYIRTTEEVNKDAIKALGLDDRQLAALGLSMADRGDMVLIKRAAGDIEKLISKLKTKLVEAMVEAE